MVCRIREKIELEINIERVRYRKRQGGRTRKGIASSILWCMTQFLQKSRSHWGSPSENLALFRMLRHCMWRGVGWESFRQSGLGRRQRQYGGLKEPILVDVKSTSRAAFFLYFSQIQLPNVQYTCNRKRAVINQLQPLNAQNRVTRLGYSCIFSVWTLTLNSGCITLWAHGVVNIIQ